MATHVLMDNADRVHVRYSEDDAAAARAALDVLSGPGYWEHTASESTAWNIRRPKLVTLFRRAAEDLRHAGLRVETDDQSAIGPAARVWEEHGLVMLVVWGLSPPELNAATSVLDSAVLVADLVTPRAIDHPLPRVEGKGPVLARAWEPADNAGRLVDYLREKRWQVDHRPPIPR